MKEAEAQPGLPPQQATELQQFRAETEALLNPR
jgi:hypothetical protein